jgi:hypothetical protein
MLWYEAVYMLSIAAGWWKSGSLVKDRFDPAIVDLPSTSYRMDF